MRKNSYVLSVICILLMAVSLVIGLYYFDAFRSHTKYVGYFVLSFIGFMETLLAGLSLGFCLKGNKGGAALVTYISTVVLSIPILLLVVFWLMFWILYFAGLQLLPPPQR